MLNNEAVIKFVTLVQQFNDMAGKASFETAADVNNQIKLIEEEANELRRDFDAGDPVKTLDGVIDVLVTTFGLAQQLQSRGFDVNKALIDTAENNMTKYPDSIDVALKTQRKFEDDGTPAIVTYNADYNLYAIQNEKTNKVLKPVGFVSNDLTNCVPESFKFKD